MPELSYTRAVNSVGHFRYPRWCSRQFGQPLSPIRKYQRRPFLFPTSKRRAAEFCASRGFTAGVNRRLQQTSKLFS